MAAAHVTTASGLGTAASPTFSITVSGTDPCLTVNIGLDSTTATVSSITWSLGSGTAVQVISARSSTAFAATWAIPAPTAGAGTVTVNLSGSTAYQIAVSVFSGADQTTPCPSGDAVSITYLDNNPAAPVRTPTNLVAGDATSGCGVNTLTNNPTGITPNARYTNSTTTVNLQAGDATGTTGITANFSDTNLGAIAMVAARIAQPAAGADLLMGQIWQ